jgi:3-oxoacyl-[acyl-carrier-protein] synthase II
VNAVFGGRGTELPNHHSPPSRLPIRDVNHFLFIGPGKKDFKLNSTKSMLGHQLGASGALEAIACIESIRTSKVHPTINHDDPEEGVLFDVVPNEAQDFKVTIALSNSFGFGGHNSSVVFGAFKQ